MAGRGPAPKDPEKRRRRNADPAHATVVTEDGQLRGPELPEGYDWHPQTLRWWTTWRSSPQAQAMTATDWDFLTDTALMHHAMWSKSQWTLAAEVRLRVAKFGATPEDRARLRMHIGEPDQDDKAAAEPRKSRYEHLRPA